MPRAESSTRPSSASAASKKSKVTTACDSCRLKRQKCDGLTPTCAACAEINQPCTYTRQSRRRGPPLGYLRHVEVRLHICDAFLGMLIEQEPQSTALFLQRANELAAMGIGEDTIERWDTWHFKWKDTDACRILDSLSAQFATPVSRPDYESPLRMTTSVHGSSGPPPLAQSSSSSRPSLTAVNQYASATTTSASDSNASSPHSKPATPFSGSIHLPPLTSTSTSAAAAWDAPSGMSSMSSTGPLPSTNNSPSRVMPHYPPAPSRLSSFRPASSENFSFAPDIGASGNLWSGDSLNFALADLLGSSQSSATANDNNGLGGLVNSSTSYGSYGMAQSGKREDSPVSLAPQHTGRSASMPPMETDSVRYQGSATGMHHQALDASYIGSFWRTPSSFESSNPYGDPSFSSSITQSQQYHPTSIDLPPIHVQQHLAEVYLQNVHPLFPLLSRSSILSRQSKPTWLVLALCAYCASISPNLGGDGSKGNTNPMLVGDAAQIAADLWYEEARSTVVNQNMRRPSDLETVQCLLFLVLRDQGRGRESQAWFLMGLSVRMSQDLGLHLNSSAWVDVPEEAKNLRRRVWGVVCILDLQLSLQLGRPSAIFDAQWASEIPMTLPPPPDAGHPNSLERFNTPAPVYFAYTSSLCLIISRINAQLYLGGVTDRPALEHKLEALKGELETWHARLPADLRVSVERGASLPVLDVNLLYQTAVILLYRPFRDHPTIPATQVSLEAAGMASMLLAMYRNTQPLQRSNPHICYLVFTAAIAHLTGLRALRSSATGPNGVTGDAHLSTIAYATALHLSECIDALREMSVSWPLAERCHQIMSGVVALEGLGDLVGQGASSQQQQQGRPASPHGGQLVQPFVNTAATAAATNAFEQMLSSATPTASSSASSSNATGASSTNVFLPTPASTGTSGTSTPFKYATMEGGGGHTVPDFDFFSATGWSGLAMDDAFMAGGNGGFGSLAGLGPMTPGGIFGSSVLTSGAGASNTTPTTTTTSV